MKNHSKMIFLLFFGYVIVYIDKTVIGFALLPIEKKFALSTQQLGYITGIFFLAYSLFQIPAGWLNDRLGYKTMLVISLCLLGGYSTFIFLALSMVCAALAVLPLIGKAKPSTLSIPA